MANTHLVQGFMLRKVGKATIVTVRLKRLSKELGMHIHGNS